MYARLIEHYRMFMDFATLNIFKPGLMILKYIKWLKNIKSVDDRFSSHPARPRLKRWKHEWEGDRLPPRRADKEDARNDSKFFRLNIGGKVVAFLGQTLATTEPMFLGRWAPLKLYTWRRCQLDQAAFQTGETVTFQLVTTSGISYLGCHLSAGGCNLDS
jgi:hypothetical protein